MPELLLELLSEEVPARLQSRATADLKRLITKRLDEAGLGFERARAFATPRRLAVVVDGVPATQPERTVERKGPKVGAPETAVEGFLKSVGLTLDQVEQHETGKGTFYVAMLDQGGRAAAEVVAEIVPAALAALAWPKSMRWGAHPTRWIRPLHAILCLFDGAAVPFCFGHLAAGEASRGHRIHVPHSFRVKDFTEYRAVLEAAKVMLDGAERGRTIGAEAARLAVAEGLSLVEDEALIGEIAGLVEWPVVLIGAIDPAFMELPPEVLTAVMRTQQKYLSLTMPEGALAARFVVVANIEPVDGGTAIVAGNERVLRARLADAQFFWQRDRRRTLTSRVDDLAGIVFHDKLGMLGVKIERVGSLAAGPIGQIVVNAFNLRGDLADGLIKKAKHAASLAKADLTTQMVGEFPELQGVMGRYYARADGEHPEVAQAIAEHYAPRGPADACPRAPVSVAVALADKIDTLFWFFAIGETPTGSRDPFALRRAALGVIRLILENELRVPLRDVFREASLHPPVALDAGWEPVADELLDFFADRLKVHLREKGLRHDLVSAVFAPTGEDDLVRLVARVEALQAFLDTDDGANLLTAYKRANNILRIEEKRDGTYRDSDEVNPRQFVQDEENQLFQHCEATLHLVEDALREEDYKGAFTQLARLRPIVDAFFDHVTVNTEEPELRANRLRLLRLVEVDFARFADFSRIEG